MTEMLINIRVHLVLDFHMTEMLISIKVYLVLAFSHDRNVDKHHGVFSLKLFTGYFL